MAIDAKFFEIYSKIEDELTSNLEHRAKSLGITDVTESINMITGKGYERLKKAFGEMPENLEIDEYKAWIKSGESTDEFKVLRFLLLASITLYFGDSNSNAYLKSNNIFGYDGCFKNLETFFSLTDKAKGELSKNILNTLQSTNRDISIIEYFNEDKYIDDANLMATYMESSDDKEAAESSSDILDLVIDAFGDDIDEKTSAIVDVYRRMLAADFGLKPYKAIMTLSTEKDKALIGLKSDGGVRSEKTEFSEADKIGMQYVPIIRKLISNVKVSQERQFKPEIIIKQFMTDKETILYFPKKILEFTSLSKITGHQTTNTGYVYCSSIKENSPLAQFRDASRNLDNYCKFIEYKMNRELVDYTSDLCKTLYNSLDKKTRDKYSLETILLDPTCEKHTPFKSTVQNGLTYYIKCVTTAVILVDCNTEKRTTAGRVRSSITDFRIKVSCNTKIKGTETNLMSNRQFCEALSTVMHGNPNTLASNNPIEESLETKDNYGNHMIDYAYIFNADKVFGRPIFAYKALETVQAQGKELSWSELLLGENPDGSLCTSGGNSKINLQGGSLHYLIAGSRSGKGVMGYSLFAPAISSGLPMFYCDRKPDTAVVIKNMAPNMFAVNGGGQYEEGIDYQGLFNRGMIQSKLKIPKYVEGRFTDMSVVTDYIYFRALLLIFNLVYYVESGDTYSGPGQRETYEFIRGKLTKGMIVVIDEFTNYVNNFLGKYPTTTEWFKNCVSDGKIKKFRQELVKIKEAIAKDQKKGEDVHDALETAIENAKLALTPEQLYFTEMAEKYQQIVAAYGSKFMAGGSDFMKRKVQVFIIGQKLPVEFMGGQKAFQPSNGQAAVNRFNASTHVAKNGKKYSDVLLLEMLNQDLSPDYILGYQPDGMGGEPSYLAQRVDGIATKSYINMSRRCFCYHKPSIAYTADTIGALTDTAEYFGTNKAGMKNFLETKFTYFKPYLILNNAEVPAQELLYNDGTVDDLENKRQGKGYPQYAKSQFVGQCITNCERVGLTWDDILNNNKAPDGVSLHSGVGFEGYITQMCGQFPTESLNSSGDIMDVFVQKVFGYDGGWLDFLCDFRPEAFFGPYDFFKSVPERLTNSFFNPSLLVEKAGYSFSKIYGDELESLLHYYDGGTASDDDDTDPEAEYDDADECEDTGRKIKGDNYLPDDEDDEFGSDEEEELDFGDDEGDTPVNTGGTQNNTPPPVTIPFRTMDEFANAKMSTSSYTYEQFLDKFIDFYIMEADNRRRAEAYTYWAKYSNVLSDFYNYLSAQERKIGAPSGYIAGYLAPMINRSDTYGMEIRRFKAQMVSKMKETDELLSNPVFNSNSMKNTVTQGINKILTERISAMYKPFFTIMFKLRKLDASLADRAVVDTLSNFGL